MFENIMNFFKKLGKKQENNSPKEAAKERLHLVLMQDRANVSADFLDLMKQEIIEVIKKYIDVDENAIDVRLTNKTNSDGTTGAPALYANIPIMSIKNEVRKIDTGKVEQTEKEKKEEEKAAKEIIEKENTTEEVLKEEKVENKEKNIKEEKPEQGEENKGKNKKTVKEAIPENEKQENEEQPKQEEKVTTEKK